MFPRIIKEYAILGTHYEVLAGKSITVRSRDPCKGGRFRRMWLWKWRADVVASASIDLLRTRHDLVMSDKDARTVPVGQQPSQKLVRNSQGGQWSWNQVKLGIGGSPDVLWKLWERIGWLAECPETLNKGGRAWIASGVVWGWRRHKTPFWKSRELYTEARNNWLQPSSNNFSTIPTPDFSIHIARNKSNDRQFILLRKH